MPDLLAGTVVRAADTPVTVENVQTGTFTFTGTSYGITTASGTYADCGVAFVAPTTGRVVIAVSSTLLNSNAAVGTLVSAVVREGSVVGSGTIVKAASDNDCIQVNGTNGVRTGTEFLLEGLTPEADYNVRLEHRVTANTGTAARRRVLVKPAT